MRKKQRESEKMNLHSAKTDSIIINSKVKQVVILGWRTGIYRFFFLDQYVHVNEDHAILVAKMVPYGPYPSD